MAKKKLGRPRHTPTDQNERLVRALAMAGTPHETIADIIEITKPTLYRHYRKILDHSLTQANAAVVGKLYQNAMSGDTTAQIFWLKSKLGWSTQSDATQEQAPLPRIQVEVINKSDKDAPSDS